MYVKVLCFLTFNLCAMLGSAAASSVQWPRKERLVWPVVLRAAFVPLYLLCNYQVEGRVMPIYITNDWAYWAIAIVMGFTSGYFRYLLHECFANIRSNKLIPNDYHTAPWVCSMHRKRCPNSMKVSRVCSEQPC